MSDLEISHYWISRDKRFSINFSKVGGTAWYPDSRDCEAMRREPENKVPTFSADGLTVYGDNANNAWAHFKKFHEIEP